MIIPRRFGLAGIALRVLAAAIKQAVTGYGRASKIQVQEMTKVILCLERIPQPDHAADALAVAICHAPQQRRLRAAPVLPGGKRDRIPPWHVC